MEEINVNEEVNDFESQSLEDELIEECELQIVKPRPIGVYVRRDENGKIININSEIFLDDLTGWEKIDEGLGDEYAHAQTQYKQKIDGV